MNSSNRITNLYVLLHFEVVVHTRGHSIVRNPLPGVYSPGHQFFPSLAVSCEFLFSKLPTQQIYNAISETKGSFVESSWSRREHSRIK